MNIFIELITSFGLRRLRSILKPYLSVMKATTVAIFFFVNIWLAAAKPVPKQAQGRPVVHHSVSLLQIEFAEKHLFCVCLNCTELIQYFLCCL